jgi:hypothetical protein
VRNLANPNAGAADFVRPGHIFPLVAREGGVLMRSGHTEAAVDLCRLAGLPPVGVICELVNDDGTVMRGPQVQAFAEKNGLKQVSVADLIHYRQRKETLIEMVDTFDVETVAGPAKAYSYTLPWDPMHHLAVVFGDIRDGVDVPVRLHLESVVDDVFGKEKTMSSILEAHGGGGPRRRRLSARRLGRRRQGVRAAIARRTCRSAGPRERMARDRIGSADPERPRNRFDQAVCIEGETLCGARRFRHPDLVDGDHLASQAAAVTAPVAGGSGRPRRGTVRDRCPLPLNGAPGRRRQLRARRGKSSSFCPATTPAGVCLEDDADEVDSMPVRAPDVLPDGYIAIAEPATSARPGTASRQSATPTASSAMLSKAVRWSS